MALISLTPVVEPSFLGPKQTNGPAAWQQRASWPETNSIERMLTSMEHGQEHVDSLVSEDDHGLGMPLALGSLAVVEGSRGWAALDAD
jgi:hypothetical protein